MPYCHLNSISLQRQHYEMGIATQPGDVIRRGVRFRGGELLCRYDARYLLLERLREAGLHSRCYPSMALTFSTSLLTSPPS